MFLGIYFALTFSMSFAYTVTYDPNGGITPPDDQTKIDGEALILSDVMPQKDGYVFVEWNTQIDGLGDGYMPGGTYEQESDVTLYAMWDYATTFAAGSDWYRGMIDKSQIYEIIILESYERNIEGA